MRRLPAFGVIAVVHFVLTIVLVFVTFGAGMARFDKPDAPHWTETAASSVVNVLAFPVMALLDRQSFLRFPRLWGYVPFAVNSMVWAWAVVTVWGLRRHVPGRSP